MQSRLSSCTIHVTSGLHFTYADTSDCIISYLFLPNTEAHVQYDLVGFRLYDINLGATHTTIPSTRGVQIPIDLVSSATDSIR